MATKRRWGSFVALCAAAALLLSATGGVAVAKPRYRVRTSRVAPGIMLKKIKDRRGPNRIRALVVNPLTGVTLDVALATEELPGHETTSSMARRHDAIAAINGDFTLLPYSEGSGRPVNTFIRDGELLASPLIWGRNFSITADETFARVGHTNLRAWLTRPDGEVWPVDAVNPVDPSLSEWTLWTPEGGKLFRPPPQSCAARLVERGGPGWNEDLDGVSRNLVVDKVMCRERRMKRRGSYVLTTSWTSLNGITMQTSVFEGDAMGFGWSFNRPGVLDTIGGNPDVLNEGRVDSGECTDSYFCGRNPRTGIGLTPDDRVLLVTVDGRSKSSVGMTLPQFAKLFLYLGADSALNLDGGGSTTMVVRDRILNVPSDGFERPVGSSLVILRGPDPLEPSPTPYVTPTSTPAPTPSDPSPTTSPTSASAVPVAGAAWADGIQGITDVGCRSLLDPGSTGGMLDALARGEIGAQRDLPAELRWAVRVFRGHAVCE